MTAARRLSSALAGLGAMVALAGLAGCAAVAQSGSTQTSTADTVGAVGVLPTPSSANGGETTTSGRVTTADVPVVVDTSSTTTTMSRNAVIGTAAGGNRLLMIGDSLTASISQRYGGQACAALVPLGWQVEVDAETGKPIAFGKQVLDQRLSAGWDAAVIFLGNNYNYDRADFQNRLHALLLRLVPRPTLVITTALFRPEQADVNAAILEEAAQFQSVSVLDWATLGADPSLTGADNLHLTDDGRRALAFRLAEAIGPAPAQPGACLKTNYTNDSAGSPTGPPGNTTKPKPKPKPTTTTIASATTTATNSAAATTAPGTPTSTAVPTQTTTATTTPVTRPGTTVPTETTAPATATTAAPTTAAPTTAPPSTVAPPTVAPTTSPATTAKPVATTPAPTVSPPPTGP